MSSPLRCPYLDSVCQACAIGISDLIEFLRKGKTVRSLALGPVSLFFRKSWWALPRQVRCNICAFARRKCEPTIYRTGNLASNANIRISRLCEASQIRAIAHGIPWMTLEQTNGVCTHERAMGV